MCNNGAGLPAGFFCAACSVEKTAGGELVCDDAFNNSFSRTACTWLETTRCSSANRHSKPSPSSENSPDILRACRASLDETTLLRRSNRHCGVVTTRLL